MSERLQEDLFISVSEFQLHVLVVASLWRMMPARCAVLMIATYTLATLATTNWPLLQRAGDTNTSSVETRCDGT